MNKIHEKYIKKFMDTIFYIIATIIQSLTRSTTSYVQKANEERRFMCYTLVG